MSTQKKPIDDQTAQDNPENNNRLKSQSNTRQWLEVIGKLLIPVLLFWLAFDLKDSVEQALKHKKLEVESALAIKQLLTTLHASDIDITEATAATFTLASFGEAAIIPLIGVLQYGTPEAGTTAKNGLFVIGLAHPKEVTKSLTAVLAMRQGQFKWRTHQIVIDIMGEIGDKEALKHLKDYQKIIELPAGEGLKEWEKMVSGATIAYYKVTQRSLSEALLTFGIEWTPPTDTGGTQ